MENKPRKPWVAGLLSFVTIGLGHIYVGDAKKGILLYLGQSLILAISLLLLTFKPNIFSLLFVCFFGLAYFLFTLVDAIKSAKVKSAYYSLKKFNKWYMYLTCWFLAGFVIQPLVGSLLKENIIEAFKNPSGSMLPTLQIGDHLLVNKFIYGIKVPFSGTVLVPFKNPKPNDIVVFKYPKNPKLYYIKRVIAVAGETVEINNKKSFINGQPFDDQYGVFTDSRILPANAGPRDNFGPVKVPEGHIFVMGDNRDNSYDGRFWGFVDLQAVRGKAFILYWSWDVQKYLFSTDRFASIRWSRIGKSVH